MSISQFRLIPSNVSQYAPSNPTGTVSNVGVMMGISASFTPKYTGNVFITITSSATNTTINDGWLWQGRYGTGTAPVNGAAATGTTIANTNVQNSNLIAANSITSGSISGYITGLTLGTAIWIDILLLSVTGGTASLNGITIIVSEVQT